MDSLAEARNVDTAPRKCGPCNELFTGRDGLLKHKAAQRRAGVPGHIHCKFCGMDFVTERGEMLHIQQYHPQDQNLECPGCGHGPFTRLSALMSHIETGECVRINKEVLDTVREKKLAFAQKLEKLTGQPVKNNYQSFVSPAPDASSLHSLTPRDDPVPFVLHRSEFPGLPGNSAATRRTETDDDSNDFGQSATDVTDWGKKENLFPDAPAAKRPTADLLKALTAPSGRIKFAQEDPDHPSHVNYNVGRYYCEYSDRYNCPKTGCLKTFKKANGVTSHLNSAAHGDTTYRCPSCFRAFKTLTAITAHVESNGVFCKIRDSANFPVYIDQLTGGMVDMGNQRYEDGTVAFTTAEKAHEVFRERAQNFDENSLQNKQDEYYADKKFNW